MGRRSGPAMDDSASQLPPLQPDADLLPSEVPLALPQDVEAAIPSAPPLYDDVDPQGYRKVRKQQTFDKKAYFPEVLEQKLRELKAFARKAYWHEVSVGTKWVLDQVHGEKFQYAFIKCNACGHEHGGESINPSNFVKTHFVNCSSLPRCKKQRASVIGARGTFSM